MSKDDLTDLLGENHLDKKVLALDRLLWLVFKTENSQFYQYYDATPLGLKSRKTQYGKSQRGGESD